MTGEFRITREVELPGTPEQVFAAVTTGAANWMFPTGIVSADGTKPDVDAIQTWNPPTAFVTRMEGPNGWFNMLEFLIEAGEGGTALLRYVHEGILTDDWDNQYDGADKHTTFYLHTLGEYLAHFGGRTAVFSEARAENGGEVQRALTAMGVPDAAQVGDRVRITLGDLTADATIDYRNEYFTGLRTPTALVRIFGRSAFGATTGLTVHQFDGGADRSASLQKWLDEVYV